MQRRRILRVAWNVLLLLLAGALLWSIAPKVFAQVTLLAQRASEYSSSALFEVAWTGVEGLALLVLILLITHSLGTWAWRVNSPAVRLIYGGLGILFVLGTVVSIVRDYQQVGFIFYGNYVAFLFTYALFAFPILAFRRTYPALIASLFQAWRIRRSAM